VHVDELDESDESDAPLDELAFSPIGGEINTVLVNPWEGCTGVELGILVVPQFDPEESILQVTPSEQYP
jgi:hypothetical protein